MPRGVKRTLADVVAQFKPYVGQGFVIRVNLLNEVGLRWRLDSLDEKTGIASLKASDGIRSVKASLLDLTYAPLGQRAGSPANRPSPVFEFDAQSDPARVAAIKRNMKRIEEQRVAQLAEKAKKAAQGTK
jgi:hypothetical protein